MLSAMSWNTPHSLPIVAALLLALARGHPARLSFVEPGLVQTRKVTRASGGRGGGLRARLRRRRERTLLHRPGEVRGDVRDEPSRARRRGAGTRPRREHPSLAVQVRHSLELVGELPLDRAPSSHAKRIRAGIELRVVHVPATGVGRGFRAWAKRGRRGARRVGTRERI